MKRFSILLIKTTTTCMIFWILLRRINLHEIDLLIVTMKLSFFIAAISMFILQSLFAMFRWHLLLQVFSITQPVKLTFKVFWASMFFNSILIAGVAGDAVRAWMTHQSDAPISNAINSVLLDRLLAVSLLIIAICLSTPTLNQVFSNNPAVIKALHIFILAGFIGFILLGNLKRLPINWQRSELTRSIYQLSNSMKLLWKVSFQTTCIWSAAITSLICQILSMYFLTQALHLPVKLIDCLAFVPLVILATSLPISLGGWGVRESIVVILFGTLGVSSSAALSLSILSGCITLLISLPGGLIWLTNRKPTDILATR